jgi:DNA mismatch endonuclease, patch repair protein
MDIVDKQTRSKIMASVGQKNTAVEKMLRSPLHAAGLRYRLHDCSLPGSPDLVFPRFRAVVFIHGCYWHAHGCHRSTVPRSHRAFWQKKFEANRSRDARKAEALMDDGWRVLDVWECALRGKTARDPETVARAVHRWLASSAVRGEVAGTPPVSGAGAP